MPARSLKFESRRDILARLRLQRRAANPKVEWVLRSFDECGGGFDVAARLLMLFGQGEMRAAVKAERRSFSLARGEGVALEQPDCFGKTPRVHIGRRQR